MIWDGIFEAFLRGDLITGLILLVLGIIITIVNLLLFPIGLVLQASMPAIDSGLQSIALLFGYAGTYLSWALSLIALPTQVIIIVSSYYLLVLGSTMFIWVYKLGILWWRAKG